MRNRWNSPRACLWIGAAFTCAALSVQARAIESEDSGFQSLKVSLGTSDTTEFIEKWRHGSEHALLITPHVREYRGGQVAHVWTIVTGFETAGDGRFDLTADYRVLKPDGSVLLDRKAAANAKGISRKPRPGFGSPRALLGPALEVSFENTNVAGGYKLQVTVHDIVGRRSVKAEDTIFLLEPLVVAMNPLDLPADSPEMLDRLWALYVRTGDLQAVRRVISVLHLRKDGHGEEKLLGGAAEASLLGMAYQDARVYALCREEVRKASGGTRELLSAVLLEVDEKKAPSQSQPAAPDSPLPPPSPGQTSAPKR